MDRLDPRRRLKPSLEARWRGNPPSWLRLGYWAERIDDLGVHALRIIGVW